MINEGSERQKNNQCNYVPEFVKCVPITWKQKDEERSCMILCATNFFKYLKYNDQAKILQQDSNKKFYTTQTSSRNMLIKSFEKICFWSLEGL